MPRVRRVAIRKLFVANRGEIACRILRAARELDIRTVVGFSDADAGSLPVRMADEVVRLGPPDPAKSYLDQALIIKTAKSMGCNAIHPGYGFLAENAAFAERCRKSGLIFVGPTPKNIRDMGDKTVAKRLALEAGIPVVPGNLEPIESLLDAQTIADEFGYPLIIKAAAGGGGRGMRIVRNEEELQTRFEACRQEALAAFSADQVFLERLIEHARHFEVQILADRHGNVVHLGERDCTVQRRHQKLIEEAPSPLLSAETRSELGRASCDLARLAGYVNAGTVEFLMDQDGCLYFMEMNTRIQVEHPVTELITGVDIVRRQLLIAQGAPLDFSQEDVRFTGHAIECRINAEDPTQGFIPTPGRIEQIIFPLGPGVRVDTAAFSGSSIPREYDSLIAKVIVHANTRRDAISRMRRALLELKIGGIRSTASLHYAIMNDPVFESGEYDTNYVDEHVDRLNRREFANPEVAAIAAAVEAFVRTHRRLPKAPSTPVSQPRAWKQPGRWRSSSSGP
jgi:acetyl-CoA carboxylase biotin carboxylase subunit